MESLPIQYVAASQACKSQRLASSVDIPYKLDEGYSEDTRSQDDDSVGEEPRNGGLMDITLPGFVMGLNEAERSGADTILDDALPMWKNG